MGGEECQKGPEVRGKRSWREMERGNLIRSRLIKSQVRA